MSSSVFNKRKITKVLLLLGISDYRTLSKLTSILNHLKVQDNRVKTTALHFFSFLIIVSNSDFNLRKRRYTNYTRKQLELLLKKRGVGEKERETKQTNRHKILFSNFVCKHRFAFYFKNSIPQIPYAYMLCKDTSKI